MAWRQAGFDVDEIFRRAVSVTNEWKYTSDNGVPVVDRIAPKWMSERAIPHKLRTFQESLKPQPVAASVIHTLLNWIDHVDFASQSGQPSPPFETPNGEDIFPDEPWWLTDVQRKEEPDVAKPTNGDEDGPASSEDAADLEDAPPDDALTEDEDPLTDLDEADEMGQKKPGSELVDDGHDPVLGWLEEAAVGDQQGPTRKSSHDPPLLPLRKKHKCETLEADAACGEGDSRSSAPQEPSAFMRACGSNMDDSLPRGDQ